MIDENLLNEKKGFLFLVKYPENSYKNIERYRLIDNELDEENNHTGRFLIIRREPINNEIILDSDNNEVSGKIPYPVDLNWFNDSEKTIEWLDNPE